ncbi:hypothetical protein [Thiocapsa rosea]|uniref:Uncharacterized protein n=1 Tax=Thiocapsa rosea TaxID=69360 RepID=A0A495V4M7_9GAMM|nr:hypothetical protein [Thiocapsa rosea]RKT44224.1 hypothetical protein BDD21_1602 [Thiocapsa rosea]
MQSNVDPSTPGLWSGGLVIALLISIGLISWVQLPFKPDRPPEPREGVGYAGVQDVDARLWQDPFAAVVAVRKEARAADSRCWTIGEEVRSEDGARGMSVLTQQACKKMSPTDAPPPRRSCKQFIQGMESRIAAGKTVRIFAVMASGGPSSGAAEARRRVRYAILSGLMLDHFEPEDDEHVGYFELGIQGLPEYVPYEWLTLNARPPSETGESLVLLWLDEDGFRSSAGSKSATELAATCPQAAPTGKDSSSDNQEKPKPLEDGLIQRMGQLLETIRTCHCVHIDVMGPADSTTLQRILAEVPQNECLPGDIPFDKLWSPNATIPIDASYRGGWTDTSSACDIVLRRTIADDDRLAELLVCELKTRRVANAENIAIVGQLDTAYSRRLRDAVQRQWCVATCNEEPESERKGRQPKHTGSEIPDTTSMETCKSEFVSFGYLRGIDGQTPGASTAAASTSNSGGIERAAGDAQIDYLRRMRGALLIKDEALRSACSIRDRFKRQCGIQAIGVLGNDYYDKILVLQALKPAFPNAVFFTTDIEADMWHPEHNPYTRNLIVASGFGLTLSDACQLSVPPLRDSYQAASLLATRLIVGGRGETVNQCPDALQSPLPRPRPRLFEIGRTQAIELGGGAEFPSDTGSSVCSVENAHPEDERRRFYLVAQKGYSAEPDSGDGLPWTTLRLVAASLLLGGLLFIAVVRRDQMQYWVGVNLHPAWRLQSSREQQREGNRNAPSAERDSPGGSANESPRGLRAAGYSRLATTVFVVILLFWAILLGPLPAALAAFGIWVVIFLHWMSPKRLWLLIVLVVGSLLAVAGYFVFDDLQKGGEPFSILEGVSIWPSEIIRVVAGLLAIYFFVRAFQTQKLSMEEIGRNFHLAPTDSDNPAVATQSGRGRPKNDPGCAGVFSDPAPQVTPRCATEIWSEFRSGCSIPATLRRIAPETVLFFVLAFVLMLAFGMPNRPTRSDLSWTLDFVVIMSVLIPFLGLLFLMVDATKRTRKLADALSRPVFWPPQTLEAMNLASYVQKPRKAWLVRKDSHDGKREPPCAPQGTDVVWLDVKLIAEVTRPVGNLVWYPMWVLLLLIAARHPVFDAWSMPAAWIVVVGATALYAAGCAWVLRQSAERVRDDAKSQLDHAIRKTLDDSGYAGCKEQLAFLRDEVQGISDGAFRPFTQQPLVRAAFTAISSLSGLALLQYSSIFNL